MLVEVSCCIAIIYTFHQPLIAIAVYPAFLRAWTYQLHSWSLIAIYGLVVPVLNCVLDLLDSNKWLATGPILIGVLKHAFIHSSVFRLEIVSSKWMFRFLYAV